MACQQFDKLQAVCHAFGGTSVNKTHHSIDAGQYRVGQLAVHYPKFLNGNPEYVVEVRLLNDVVVKHLK